MFAAAALSVALSGIAARAGERAIGTPPPADVQAVMLARARAKMTDGEESFARGDFEHARSSFDDAIDVFLDSGYDLRSNPDLMAAYREAVERVNRYQAIGVDAEGDSLWPLQDYEATKDDFREPEIPETGDVLAAGDLVNASFLTRVSELQRRFHEKFGRSFTLTGRDTAVHSRLYGFGRAVDLRVRDLDSDEVQFILQNARALNMRVLDFSTPERVFQHNTRVIALGRPSDTMATGVHIHLNDMPRPAAAYQEQPAAKKRYTSSTQ